MAVIEAKILIAQIYFHFKFSLTNESKISPFFGVVMPVEGGLFVKVE
jgi:hypothetical protein